MIPLESLQILERPQVLRISTPLRSSHRLSIICIRNPTSNLFRLEFNPTINKFLTRITTPFLPSPRCRRIFRCQENPSNPPHLFRLRYHLLHQPTQLSRFHVRRDTREVDDATISESGGIGGGVSGVDCESMWGFRCG